MQAVDISDIQPIIEAEIARKDHEALRGLLQQVVKRYRKQQPTRWAERLHDYRGMAGGDNIRNAIVDLLDEDHPEWRGYRVNYAKAA